MIETAEWTSLGAMGCRNLGDSDALPTIRHIRLGPVSWGKVDSVAFCF